MIAIDRGCDAWRGTRIDFSDSGKMKRSGSRENDLSRRRRRKGGERGQIDLFFGYELSIGRIICRLFPIDTENVSIRGNFPR